MALSPRLSKKLPEPYLISYFVLSITIFAVAVNVLASVFTVTGNEISFVIPLIVNLPVTS
jgi:hypothetical protein